MRHALPAVSILALMMACSPALAQETAPNIDAARMNESVRVLASDDFEGRAPASAGERMSGRLTISISATPDRFRST